MLPPVIRSGTPSDPKLGFQQFRAVVATAARAEVEVQGKLFLPSRGICSHSLYHWICIEKCVNTHLNANPHGAATAEAAEAAWGRVVVDGDGGG